MAEKAASKKKAKNAAKPNEPAKEEKTSQPTILDAKKPWMIRQLSSFSSG
jgi:hypothetical protein